MQQYIIVLIRLIPQILQDALKDAQELKNDLAITRIIIELAELYLEMDNLDEADRLYRETVHRLVD